MCINNVTLHLIGKKYIDRLLYIDKMKPSETNNINKIQDRLGGIFNITDSIPGIHPIYSSIGKKHTIIINEITESRRTSLVRECDDLQASEAKLLRTAKHDLILNLMRSYDWTHIAYCDDVEYDFINKHATNISSVDFCTTVSRHRFKGLIDQCNFIFDSRERKHLYENLDTDTIIILHDPNGCEAIFKGIKVVEYNSPPPISGLSVNGAGDIFAAVFIREFITNDLKNAILTSCEITTNLLKEKTKNEKI